MQRRIQKPNGRRQPLQFAEDAYKIFLLIRQQFLQRGLPLFQRLGQDHLAHRVDPVALEEHVFSPAKSDSLGSKGDRRCDLFRRIGIGPNIELT